jgi:hypothetical protein
LAPGGPCSGASRCPEVTAAIETSRATKAAAKAVQNEHRAFVAVGRSSRRRRAWRPGTHWSAWSSRQFYRRPPSASPRTPGTSHKAPSHPAWRQSRTHVGCPSARRDDRQTRLIARRAPCSRPSSFAKRYHDARPNLHPLRHLSTRGAARILTRCSAFPAFLAKSSGQRSRPPALRASSAPASSQLPSCSRKVTDWTRALSLGRIELRRPAEMHVNFTGSTRIGVGGLGAIAR